MSKSKIYCLINLQIGSVGFSLSSSNLDDLLLHAKERYKAFAIYRLSCEDRKDRIDVDLKFITSNCDIKEV